MTTSPEPHDTSHPQTHDPSGLPPAHSGPAVAAPSRPRKRNKVSWSCTECRKRKKLCDRRVPNCGQCIAREVTHLCRWGDERDDYLALERNDPGYVTSPQAPYGAGPLQGLQAPLPPSHAVQPQTPTTATTAQGSSSTVDRQAEIVPDITAGLAAPTAATDSRSPSFGSTHEQEQAFNRQGQDWHGFEAGDLQAYEPWAHPTALPPFFAIEPPPPMELTAAQAKTLLGYEIEDDIHAKFVDFVLGLKACHEAPPGPLKSIQSSKPDVYALVLGLCTAALNSMPPSYAIAVGVVETADELGRLVAQMDLEAQQTLASIREPTLVSIQARYMFVANFGHRAQDVETLDSTIRGARSLGLDRLATPQEDETIWQDENRPRATGSQTIWSAETFRSRDHKARNLGRLHWQFLRAEDWSRAPFYGSCSVNPHSYTTSIPCAYSTGTADRFLDSHLITYLDFNADVLRRFADICGKAEGYGLAVEYDAVLVLDAEVQQRLQTVRETTSTSKVATLLIKAALWHCLFIIHRPFICVAAYSSAPSGPDPSARAASRTWKYAMLTIQTFRQDDRVFASNTPQLFRMIQAALVLISHLFLRADVLCKKEMMQVHDQVQFVIQSCRRVRRATQGQKLEAVLAAAAKVRRKVKQDDVKRDDASTSTRDASACTAASTTDVSASSNDASSTKDRSASMDSDRMDAEEALDKSLIRLIYGCEVGAPDELWSDVLQRVSLVR
ncbi:unnamed protein product [Jaminaea pallidilutea]